MKQHRLRVLLTGIVLFCCRSGIAADPVTLTVHLDKVEHAISPTLHGVFFEDINFAADGGLCPELVKNGSFEFTPDPLMGWHRVNPPGNLDQVSIGTEGPLNTNNPHFLSISRPIEGNLSPEREESSGLTNDGFRGMGVQQDARYTFSVYARSATPVSLEAEVQDSRGGAIGHARIDIGSSQWKKYSAEITAARTDAHARLLIELAGPGSIDLDMVSLFPQDTFNQHGLRPDLVQLLKDMHPKFMRFPGGCIVEGRTLDNRYQWKNTIGDLTQRKMNLNRWNSEFSWRPSPDYFQSYHLGFYEFFQLCEDIGASPLPILNCGMSCQYNTGELVPMDQLDPYIQDALDLIEFANGPADSQWGKKRIEMGHLNPFNLKRIGIGNEQWGPHYIERYAKMASAIKTRYPDIELVAAAGPSPNGVLFDYAWKQLSALKADILDEHYYAGPEFFLKNAGRYDHYPRTGPKVFAGEFAAQSVGIASPENKNNWRCALAEAAFMTGLERNSDLVVMSSYAPLFGHVDAWQWTPNLIWFDSLNSFGTPNYYVQQMFGASTGDSLLSTDLTGDPTGLFITASRDDSAGDVILKIVNTQPEERSLHLDLAGRKLANLSAASQVLASPDLNEVNSLSEPTRLAPRTTDLGKTGQVMDYKVPASSLTVLRFRVGK